MIPRRFSATPKLRSSWLLSPAGLFSSLCLGMVVLLTQDGELFGAVSAGAIAMVLTYSYQQSAWRSGWRRRFVTFWRSPMRPLVVAVGVGSLATILWEMVLAIWRETPNHWLALALTTQLLATLGVLALLLQHQWQNYLVEENDRQPLSQLPPTQKQALSHLYHNAMEQEAISLGGAQRD